MGSLGYAAMFEQFHPTDLLRWSREAQDAGFTAVMASDHFHPWTPQQGQAGFVWAWMGALGAQELNIHEQAVKKDGDSTRRDGPWYYST